MDMQKKPDNLDEQIRSLLGIFKNKPDAEVTKAAAKEVAIEKAISQRYKDNPRLELLITAHIQLGMVKHARKLAKRDLGL